MENTLENKAKFFALYWHQLVLIRNINNPQYDDKIILSAYNYDGWLDKSVLELKPLSSISDEDARFLGYSDAKSATTTYFKTLGKNTNDADYLRSRGYALPWMWLSVEQQIEYGWIKLKGETKL